MDKIELKQLIKNTNLFDDESRLSPPLSNTTKELKSILGYELEHIPKGKIKDFISNILDYYKEEILNQDKTAYRTIITEIDKESVRYITEHRHPVGTFISELDNTTFAVISTISDLSVDYYPTRNEMLAALIIKNCFAIHYDPQENDMQIQVSLKTVDKVFSEDILRYIKSNIKDISKDLTDNKIFLNYKDELRYDMFRDYLDSKLSEVFINDNAEYPNINMGDVIKTKYFDKATVIGIDTKNGTLKLSTEVQNDITVFTDVINYKDTDFIKEIENNMEMEAS